MTSNGRAAYKNEEVSLHVSFVEKKNNNSVITGPIVLNIHMHVPCRHPPGNEFLCHSLGATARVHVQCRSQLSRTAEPIVLKFDTVIGTGPGRRVACKNYLGPTLHVRMYSVTAPDLKNDSTDCAQIWYADRDRLVGSDAVQSVGNTSHSFARAELILSLARLSPQTMVSY